MGCSGGDRVRGCWTPEEDANLIKLVEQHGPRNWSMISGGVPGRSGKSCRLRWCNQLSPEVQHRPFTPSEDAIIVQEHAIHGNKWATIARLLPGRTDNAVKNHWNSTLRRCRSNHNSSGSSHSNFAKTRRNSDGELGAKRQRICVLEEEQDKNVGGVVGPETLLTLLPPGNAGVGSGNDEEAVVVKVEEGGDVKNGGKKSEMEMEVPCLLAMVRRMIAEEVRIYMEKFRLGIAEAVRKKL